MLNCYLITVSWTPNIAWFEFADSVTQALQRVRVKTQRQGILDRDLRCQEWCGLDLQTIMSSGAWTLLDVEQKIGLLLATAKDLLTQQKTVSNDMSRLTEYLGINVIISNIENGKV